MSRDEKFFELLTLPFPFREMFRQRYDNTELATRTVTCVCVCVSVCVCVANPIAYIIHDAVFFFFHVCVFCVSTGVFRG
jgi:hypothetical protein